MVRSSMRLHIETPPMIVDGTVAGTAFIAFGATICLETCGGLRRHSEILVVIGMWQPR
jgi:hypothetical protein